MIERLAAWPQADSPQESCRSLPLVVLLERAAYLPLRTFASNTVRGLVRLGMPRTLRTGTYRWKPKVSSANGVQGVAAHVAGFRSLSQLSTPPPVYTGRAGSFAQKGVPRVSPLPHRGANDCTCPPLGSTAARPALGVGEGFSERYRCRVPTRPSVQNLSNGRASFFKWFSTPQRISRRLWTRAGPEIENCAAPGEGYEDTINDEAGFCASGSDRGRCGSGYESYVA